MMDWDLLSSFDAMRPSVDGHALYATKTPTVLVL
jgi:hypothetical protein